MKEKWIALLQDRKSSRIILILAFAALAVVILLPDGKSKKEPEAVSTVQAEESSYEQEMERRLEQILQNIEGAGRVEVMVTLKVSQELVAKEDHAISMDEVSESDSSGGVRKSVSSSDDGNTVFSGDMPFVTKTIEPQPEGIIVLADGADSPQVVSQIHSALMALFDLPSHKIQVLKRESGK